MRCVQGAGERVTFKEYFRRLNIALSSDAQPLLLVEERRGKRPVRLPAEVCCLTGLSEAMLGNPFDAAVKVPLLIPLYSFFY
jgi:hypothetical protein